MPYNTRTQYTQRQFNFYAAPPDYMDMNVYGDGTNANPYQNIASTNQDRTPLMIGTLVQTFDGRVFKYVKYTDAGASAVEGNVLAPIAGTAISNIDSSSADLLSITNAGETWTVGAFKGFWVHITDSTGEGQTRRIVWNEATTLYLERPLTTALAATSDGIIWSPHHVCQTTTTPGINGGVSGISIGAITTAQYGWMQVDGFCEGVIVEATPVINDLMLLAPSAATAGYALIITNGETPDDVNVFGRALQVHTNVDLMAPTWLYACQG